MQSAVFTATTAPGVFSSSASPLPSTPVRPSAATHSAECTCCKVARLAKARRDVGETRAEAVHQPFQGIEFGDAVDLARILVKHG